MKKLIKRILKTLKGRDAQAGLEQKETLNKREHELIQLTLGYGKTFVIESSHSDFGILESLVERGLMTKTKCAWPPISRFFCTQKARGLVGREGGE